MGVIVLALLTLLTPLNLLPLLPPLTYLTPLTLLTPLAPLPLQGSEPQSFIDAKLHAEGRWGQVGEGEVGELLSVFYSRTQQSDQVAVEAKLEICKTLHLIYDMYTDLRIKTLVARYRQLFDEWITHKLWRKKGDNGHPLKPFEETVPFDKPDDGVERKLPASVHAQYPGLDTHLTYADVFERKWLLSLEPRGVGLYLLWLYLLWRRVAACLGA